ncbi:PhzF family phenazine biosynthesis protein [Tissierella sp.]|uniref:PhzF family phenazine biosynthesis protein n=1 Tax=Tissierella sp. TaxID=41274 RepID=UPI0028629F86|nr:PhzF family phenazine biosynthesis protein [Tissierella sp.]MDR7854978.1 PhzF family phenazine biosynthesis protein [Tissierella sp.]
MELTIYQVDAFSNKAFGGNPAGVVPDARFLTEENMQNIAKEMNLSETAFATLLDEDLYSVRFFTPTCEVDLCGHATIGTFYTLAKMGYIKPILNGRKTVYQKTKAGKLAVDIIFKDREVDKVYMEQATPKTLNSINNPEELLKAMGMNLEDLGVLNETIYPDIITTGLPDIILPVKSKEALDNLHVDMKELSKISQELGVVGVHAFYLPDLNSPIVYTRNFAPLVGIDEEAATGTSNGVLIYFLKTKNLIDRNNIVSYQGESMNRPSQIHCNIEETDGKYIVKVGGESKIVISGILLP